MLSGIPDGFELYAQDGEVGEPIDVFVSSESEPFLEFEGAKLKFEKTRRSSTIQLFIRIRQDSMTFQVIQ